MGSHRRRPQGARVHIPLWAGLLLLPIVLVLTPAILVAWISVIAAAGVCDGIESLLEAWRGKDKT